MKFGDGNEFMKRVDLLDRILIFTSEEVIPYHILFEQALIERLQLSALTFILMSVQVKSVRLRSVQVKVR